MHSVTSYSFTQQRPYLLYNKEYKVYISSIRSRIMSAEDLVERFAASECIMQLEQNIDPQLDEEIDRITQAYQSNRSKLNDAVDPIYFHTL